MSPLPSDLKNELQKEYVATFDQKIFELDHAFQAKDVESLKNIFHKLAGSGETYEMDEMSNIAKLGQKLLKDSFPEDKVKKAIDALKNIFKERKKLHN